MAVNKARVFYMSKQFKGEPKATDFELKEEKLLPLKDGEILLEAEWLSVDPYMRAYMQRYPAGSKMIGGQVAKVIESKNTNYAVGDYLVGYLGWASHSARNPDLHKNAKAETERLEKVLYTDVSPSYSLGVLGMPGFTAYFGFLEICRPQKGDVVVVSGAAGAVGSIVGQIAKIKGCTVIGFAGTDEKVEWLKKSCKLDFAYNYKKIGVVPALKECSPTGVDCYFDNVGGTFSSAVLSQMKPRGRIAVCGSISTYNDDMSNPPMAPVVQGALVFKELCMEGFIVGRWIDRYSEANKNLYQWLKEGKIVTSEKIYEGFESLPSAFIGLLRGENTGKALVRAKKLH